MDKLSTITAKIDPILKAEVEIIFQDMDLSMNDAINLFLVQVKRCNALPFETGVPNKQTDEAINQARKGIDMIVCDNENDMFKKLGI
ncbi:MAG: type II toxin-antitoxin system RelB/DinJ family antitoxin [Desulfamplus sp.]|nr:type II toxin-antitoxin system RelB/DinJ family antitoxin [Desulfamplus sp.]